MGHFVLVNRIASLMGTGSRLINLSSSGHRFSNVDLDDPNFDCHVGQVVADDAIISAISEGVSGYALDSTNAATLWKKSEEMVGESF